jgi:hypothetical protein
LIARETLADRIEHAGSGAGPRLRHVKSDVIEGEPIVIALDPP